MKYQSLQRKSHGVSRIKSIVKVEKTKDQSGNTFCYKCELENGVSGILMKPPRGIGWMDEVSYIKTRGKMDIALGTNYHFDYDLIRVIKKE